MDQNHSPGTARGRFTAVRLIVLGLVMAAGLAGTVILTDIISPGMVKPGMICAWSSGCSGDRL
jgi:hypothetical protein